MLSQAVLLDPASPHEEVPQRSAKREVRSDTRRPHRAASAAAGGLAQACRDLIQVRSKAGRAEFSTPRNTPSLAACCCESSTFSCLRIRLLAAAAGVSCGGRHPGRDSKKCVCCSENSFAARCERAVVAGAILAGMPVWNPFATQVERAELVAACSQQLDRLTRSREAHKLLRSRCL